MDEEMRTALRGIPTDRLIDLLLDFAARVPGGDDFLRDTVLGSDGPVSDALADEVAGMLATDAEWLHRYEAADYADQANEVVALLEEAPPSRSVVAAVERALPLMIGVASRADDHYHDIHYAVRQLLELHATAVRAVAEALTDRDRIRLADWLVHLLSDDDPARAEVDTTFDIAAYRDGLGTVGLARFRAGLTDDTDGLDRIRCRLAVIDADPEAIVRAHGGEPATAAAADALVTDLRDAGLDTEAIRYARLGIELPERPYSFGLTDFLVERAEADGDPPAAVALRRRDLQDQRGWREFSALRATATQHEVWESERAAAESVLRTSARTPYLSYLLDVERFDEAWEFASANVAAAKHSMSDIAGMWPALCAGRAIDHPSDVLETYRTLVTELLDVGNAERYQRAAELLKDYQRAAIRAGAQDEFDHFLGATIDRNRRRPRCMAEFAKVGLR